MTEHVNSLGRFAQNTSVPLGSDTSSKVAKNEKLVANGLRVASGASARALTQA